MKKIILIVTMLLLSITLLTACKDSASEKENSDFNDENQYASEATENNKDTTNDTRDMDVTLYEDDNYKFICKGLSGDGMIMEVSNKTSKPITYGGDSIAFDGVLMPEASLHEGISPESTGTIIWLMNLSTVDHKVMSGSIDIWDEKGQSIKSADFIDIELGGKENLEYNYEKHTLLFENESIVIYYNGFDSSTVNFTIENKRKERCSISDSSLAINSIELGESGFYTPFAPLCTGEYTYHSDTEITSIEKLSATFSIRSDNYNDTITVKFPK